MAAIKSDVPAIGIDLGTTYSCVGVFRHGQVEIIANDHGHRITPSYVVFTDTERLIGEAAKNAMYVKPTNSVYDAKRLIGRRFDDPIVQEDMKLWPFQVINEGGKPKIQIKYKNETKSFLPEEISSMVLMKMKETAEAFLGKAVTNAVVTVPAYFNDAQRRATKDAGTIAGLNIIRIINEPTAAAIAYGFRKMDGKERNVLIFDLGGGTFDVSILAIRDGIFKVRSTNGDTHLGGGDFDSRMVDHFVEEFKRKYKKDPSTSKRSMSRLRSACDRAKRSLSISAEASIAIDSFYEGEDFYACITRARFEELNMDLFRSTMKFVQMAIDDAGMVKSQIDKIVLVGGSTRIPKIQKMVLDFFVGKKLIKSINPDEAVAYGATIQAAILQGDKSSAVRNLLLYDVAPLSLGIEILDAGIMSTVVLRNTPIPTKITKPFTTIYNNQTEISFPVYEGERSLTKDNNFLGKFILKGIPPAKRRVANVDVTFDVEADGLLNVTAIERTTGSMNTITITNDENRPTRHQMELMIADAERYRSEDAKQRTRAIARNELEYFCSDIKSSAESRVMAQDSEILRDTLLEKIEQTIHWLDDNELVTEKEMSAKKEELKLLWNETNLRSRPKPVVSLQEESSEGAACSLYPSDEEEEIISVDNVKQKTMEEVD